MSFDKIKLYTLEIILTIVLFIALIVSNKVNNTILALLLIIFYITFSFLLKKKQILSTDSKKVNAFIIVCGVLYVGLYYLIGILINSYLKIPIALNFKSFIDYIIPLVLIIVFSELIRKKLVSQTITSRIFNKKINVSLILTFIIMVLIDMIIYTRTYSLTNLDDFLMILGFVFFSSVSCNLFFIYVARRYGVMGNIFFRIITILYVYIIPVIPNMYVFFKTFFRMIYPFIMYLIIESIFGKRNKLVSRNIKRKNTTLTIIPIVIMLCVIALISCQFKYGILVIGSESMHPNIDKGDAIVFEKYNNNNLNEGDIIIFWKYNIKTVHRIVKIEKVNGIVNYYTKGDGNESLDTGFITKNDIIGVVDFKIKYIGYPTLWLRDMFNKK